MSSFKVNAINGAKWTSLSALICTVLQLSQMVISTRILDSSAVGLLAMITIFIGFGEAFVDMGLGNAVIQHQKTTKKELSSMYWFNLFLGFFFFTIFLFIIPIIVDFFNEPRLNELLYMISIIFLIIPFGQQFQILLQKNLRFNTLARIDIFSMLISTICVIVFLHLNFGVKSLVYGQIINFSIKTFCLLYIGLTEYKPSLHFKFNDLKKFLSFGLYQMGEKIVFYVYYNLDNIIIGRILGADLLGYYSIANNIVSIPANKINPIITKVAFPVFSKIQHNNNQLKNGYLSIIRALCFINTPLYLGLYAVAFPLIVLVFGVKWEESVIILKMLCLAGLLRTIQNPIGSLLMSKGRADWGFRFNLVKTLILGFSIWFGAVLGGILGVTIFKVISSLVENIICYFLVKKIIGPCIKEYLNSIFITLIISIVMYMVVYITGLIFNAQSLFLVFMIQVIIGIITFLFLCIVFKREYLSSLKTRTSS
jgi:lipopolysaccharide exporter